MPKVDEQLTRAELAQIPDGVFRYTDQSDGDGVTDSPITITVTLTVSGSDLKSRASLSFLPDLTPLPFSYGRWASLDPNQKQKGLFLGRSRSMRAQNE